MRFTRPGVRSILSAGLALGLGAAGLASVSVRADAPSPLGFDVVPTVFLVHDGSGLLRILEASVDNPGPEAEATVAAAIDGRPAALSPSLSALRLKPGKNVFEIRVPEVAKPAKARLTLTPKAVPGQASAFAPVSREIDLAPQPRWTIYLLHHSHTDIGYTELQSRVAQNHAEYLDSVIDYCRETDSYPDDARFRWNIEVSWAMEYFGRARPEARVRALAELIRLGRVELSGLYLQLSDTFAHEELVRTVDTSLEVGRRYGFEVRSAMNNDVTGFSWAVPQIFARSGIRYFASGINETRSRAPLRRPNAFWWEAPDGSRILHWNGEHYLFANYELLLHEAIARSSPKVNDYLSKLQTRGDYPCDFVALNISAWTTDNCPPGRALSDRVRDWNDRYAFPKLRLATMREFFERMEREAGTRLPVHRLAWPDYWTDGVASTAYETGLNRIAHNELLSAEKVSALAALLGPGAGSPKAFAFPAGPVREAHVSSMLYDEHTWGAYNSVDEPWSELARGQWAVKSGYAYQAREASRTLLRRGLEALARTVGAAGDHELLVFNPLSWERTDVVRVTLPAGPLREAGGRLRVIDRRTGAEAKFQPAGDDAILLVAPGVPPIGYAVFGFSASADASARAGRKPGTPGSNAGNVVESRFYRVTADPKTGGITSLVDKELGRELVDGSSSYPLNTYIYEQPEGGRKAVDDMTKRAKFRRWTPEKAEIRPGALGPVTTDLIVRSSPKMCSSLEQRVILYDDIKRVDFFTFLDKEETFTPEAVYFAFPFAVGPGTSAPAVRFEIADADMAPESEQLPGTTRDWQTVQHWVEFAGADARVAWSPVEAPLVQFGDINTGRWLRRLDLRNAWVFSYAMNNYWMTNFKAGQGGRVEFRYSLTSAAPGAGVSDRVWAGRFGWEVHTPLAVAWLPARNPGRFASPADSFLSVDSPNVIVQALWADAEGLPVVRLREIAGLAADTRLRSVPLLGFKMQRVGKLETVGPDSVPVRLKPFEIKTVRLAN